MTSDLGESTSFTLLFLLFIKKFFFPFSTFSTQHEEDEGLKLIEGAIRALKWLRDPFIRMNLLSGENMIRYTLAVEQYEKFHVKAFYEDMIASKNQFFENRNLKIKYCDEMTELMELGEETVLSVQEHEQRRVNHDKILQEVFNKASAMYWNSCLQVFDDEWSPWTSSMKDKSQYIISLHRDQISRRMVMKRGSEVYDHSDAAYWGGRGREQSEYDQLLNAATATGSTPGDGVPPTPAPENTLTAVDSTSSSSFLKNTLEMTRPKLSRLKSANDWDDEKEGSGDDNEDIEETSLPIIDRPDKGNGNSLVRFPFQHIEKKKPLWASTFIWHSDEREIYTIDVTQIMTEQALSGTLLLTNKSLYFHPKKRMGGFATNPDEFHNKRWKLEKLVECYGRRYLLQNCGLELFFEDSSEFFITFPSTYSLHKFFRELRKQSSCCQLRTGSSLAPARVYQTQAATSVSSVSVSASVSSSSWTEMWKKRLISNFEYLMRLNIMSGRSYNDITQYPVLPWVLQDYTSSTIDLNDHHIYRDLSKPIGALNEHRLKEILERYKSFGDDSDMPSFMYGSHYSSAGIILHFLVRQEPFTSMAITLQGGRFDCPDRLFFNIKDTWKCCNHSLSDVKELVPELFYLPELFMNTNNLPLGELQDDRGVVNHVLLPPWCSSNPYEFIRLHRDALESDYVSDHLHEWIDLIFGYKQIGPAAVEACNVFHYLTYEGAIDIDSIQDPLTRNATKAQVTHFGQTPSQLLTKEHPKRLPREECQTPFTSTWETLKRVRCFTPTKQFSSLVPSSSSSGGGQESNSGSPPVPGSSSCSASIVTFQATSEKLIVFYSDYTIASYKWNHYPDSSDGGLPFTMRPEKIKSFPYSALTVFPYTCTQNLDQQRLDSNSVDLTTSSYFGLFSLTKKPSKPIMPTTTTVATPAETTTPVTPGAVASTPTPVSRSRSQSLMKFVQGKKIQKKNLVLRLAENSNYDRLLTCGYWDCHMKAHSLDTFREIATSTGGHVGGINCVCMGDDKSLVVTGGDDGTCRVWVLENPTMVLSLTVDQEMHYNITHETNTDPPNTNSTSTLENSFGHPENLKCVHVLWGHHVSVTALVYSHYHDLILSGGEDGLLCVHTARKGEYIRSIYTMTTPEKQQPLTDLRELCQGEGHPIDQVEISTSGYLYAYCSTNLHLCVFWINGQFLHKITLQTRSSPLLFLSPSCSLSLSPTLSLYLSLSQHRVSVAKLLRFYALLWGK
jgi:hypothetical protein